MLEHTLVPSFLIAINKRKKLRSSMGSNVDDCLEVDAGVTDAAAAAAAAAVCTVVVADVTAACVGAVIATVAILCF